jgi:4-hydroxy-tetrahydrodipicolinate synthase
MTVRSFTFGLVHAPVTPFVGDGIDFERCAKLLDFQIAHGAEGLALPMHVGESVNISVANRQALLEFAVKHVRSRVPVIAHVSESGTAIAASLAAHAQKAGAAATIAAAPYYWKPPHSMLLEHFAAIGSSASLPFYLYNAPDEVGGVAITTELVLKLIDRLPNFSGIIDASLDWQFMIEVISSARRAKPDFQLVSATEYMISARAIGATGLLSSLSNIAPKLVRDLYGYCRTERYPEARDHQTGLAILHRLIKPLGVSGVKAAMALMGRDCRAPRAPLPTLAGEELTSLREKLPAIPGIGAEPKGWG